MDRCFSFLRTTPNFLPNQSFEYVCSCRKENINKDMVRLDLMAEKSGHQYVHLGWLLTFFRFWTVNSCLSGNMFGLLSTFRLIVHDMFWCSFCSHCLFVLHIWPGVWFVWFAWSGFLVIENFGHLEMLTILSSVFSVFLYSAFGLFYPVFGHDHIEQTKEIVG
jgi:hypothetical protein